MPLLIESRRKRPETLKKMWPGLLVADVTSNGPEPWVRFSPFYPHGGIPIPNSPGRTAQSVEGLWQGLKVFEKEDVDPKKWAITTMRGIKRSGRSRGAVRGHRFGVGGDTLLGYRDARYRIYLPAYRHVLETYLTAELARLREALDSGPVILLDYETNQNADDLTSPLSHAALVRQFIEGTWPQAGG